MLESPNSTVKVSTFAEIVEEFGFEVFGVLDKKQDGIIGSEFPCWYLDNHIEEEERLIHNEEVQLARGGVHAAQRFDVEQRVRTERARLDAIKEARPKLTAEQVDKLGKVHRELGSDIKAAMPTQQDLDRGYADIAHEEVKRLDSQVVPVTKLAQRFIILCNGFVDNGKVNRIHAEKAWKIAGKILEDGKGTNTEALRRAK